MANNQQLTKLSRGPPMTSLESPENPVQESAQSCIHGRSSHRPTPLTPHQDMTYRPSTTSPKCRSSFSQVTWLRSRGWLDHPTRGAITCMSPGPTVTCPWHSAPVSCAILFWVAWQSGSVTAPRTLTIMLPLETNRESVLFCH